MSDNFQTCKNCNAKIDINLKTCPACNKNAGFKTFNTQAQPNVDTANLKMVASWIIGIFCLFNIFGIASTPLKSIFAVIAGCLLTPPIHKKLAEKFNILNNQKINIALVILTIFLSGTFSPTPTLGYVNTDGTVLCNEPNANTGFERLPILEPVKVYKNHYKTNGFYKTEMENWIQESKIVFEGSKEYEIAKAAKYKKDKALAEAKKQEAKAKEEAEKIVKKYMAEREQKLHKIIAKTFDNYDIQEYSFDYYIHPISWYNSSLEDKKIVMSGCAEYGAMSTNQNDLTQELSLARTKIKSSLNGETLGEYSVWNGFQFK